jgi:hypothetical protein
MRFPMLAFFLIIAALLGNTEAGNAQSPYSYPWCSINAQGGGGRTVSSRSCYYTSKEQCMATVGYGGGFCVESPYYHPQPAPPPQLRALPPRAPHPTGHPHHHRHF